MALELDNGKGSESSEGYNRKGKDCLEETVGRNTDIKGNSSEDSEQREMHSRESFFYLWIYIVKNRIFTEIWKLISASEEVSEGNQEHDIGNGWKGDPCYKVAENLAELCCTVGWKAEFISDQVD